jgi:uncharacterized radical SAM protein YgiQ
MFLPTTRKEMDLLGWDRLDVILVTGDSYIDSPYIGSAVIGKVLLKAGFRVGIIAQPAIDSEQDICRLGEPALFWGVTAGSIDSMVANYTATKKKRRSDDYTPGGINNRRPDRATIVYSNLIRRFFKQTKPIVLGGIEASLRRIAHYDFWSDSVRRSILFDAKADFLLYGMAENSVVELATILRSEDEGEKNVHNIRGLCYISKEIKTGYLELPAFDAVSTDKSALIDMYHLFYQNNDPISAKGLTQKHNDRYLVQNPPGDYLTQAEMDAVYGLDYERLQHPYYDKQGKVQALETIKFAISTHRGCYGECNFCAIAVHEGRTVRWRSQESILSEAKRMTKHPDFKGYILDAGGPTANMYGFECKKKLEHGSCAKKRCVSSEICPLLEIDHQPQIELLKKLRRIPGIKKVFIASGIRYDMVLVDSIHGREYLQEVIEHHVSGQMKIAPEHVVEHVLQSMGKPGKAALERFKAIFDQISQQTGKQQFLTYYLIAAHPGCSEQDMIELKRYTTKKLNINPEQVQIFTPTPSTYSSLMYYTEMDPFTRAPIFVEKDIRRKTHQKKIITTKSAKRVS